MGWMVLVSEVRFGVTRNKLKMDRSSAQSMSSFATIPFFIYSRHNFELNLYVPIVYVCIIYRISFCCKCRLEGRFIDCMRLFLFRGFYSNFLWIWQCVYLQEIAMMRLNCCISIMINVLIQCEAHNEIKRVHTVFVIGKLVEYIWNGERGRLSVHETSSCRYVFKR